MKTAPHQLRSESGFNLIEVSLALAICAIGILTLVGLLPTGIEASRRVSDDTVLTSLSGDMLHWRRITPWEFQPWLPWGGPRMTDPRPATVAVNFDAMGNLNTLALPDGTTAPNPFYAGPYFRYTYTVQDHPQFPGNRDIARLIITVEWPCKPNDGLPVPNANRRQFVSTYTRYR